MERRVSTQCGGYESQHVAVHGHKIRIVSRNALEPGERSSLPLVVIGGMGANYELLEPLLSCCPEHRVIVIEPPGTGGSSTPQLPMPMETFAKITRDALDKLDHPRVNLMGVSWGGALAQELAHRFPKRCKNLILASTSPGLISIPANPSVLAKYVTPRRFTDPRYMEEIAGEIYGGVQKTNPEIASNYAKSIKMARGPGYYWQLWAASTWTSYHWLHQIEQPTLVIAGDDDPLIPLQNAKILAAHIPDAHLEVLSDGHLLFLSQPKKVAGLICAFLAEKY